MIASPIATQSTPPARRRGRQAAEETPFQQVEGHFYGISAELTHAATSLGATATHDELADRCVRLAAGVARELVNAADPRTRARARAILAYCAEYERHDAQEDAQVAHAGVRVASAHTEARHGAALIERLEARA